MQTLQRQNSDKQDTLALPAYRMLDALRSAIEASGTNIPTGHLLTATLHAATAQAIRQLRKGTR